MSGRPHLLVVDDDPEIRDLLARFLEKRGYRVDTAADGAAMFDALKAGAFDLVVLDLMLPGEDGLSLCRRLRRESELPVVMLTALGEEPDRIAGLEIGADDYVAKPFSPRELLARIRAVLRRYERAERRLEPLPEVAPEREWWCFAGWRLDPATRELQDPEGVVVTLTAGEFDLLRAFVERPQRVLSRDQLLDLTRGREPGPFDRSVDVQLGRLRRKIEADPKHPRLIKTVRGGGYVLAAAVHRERG
ncbi:MAG: response regulator [Alphaproteobacteria bacterium]